MADPNPDLVKAIDELADKALTGEAQACAWLYVGADGKWYASAIGFKSGLEACGAFTAGGAILAKNLF